MSKIYKKCMASVLCVLLAALAFSGCSSPVNVDQSGAAGTQEYPVTVNEVTINKKPTKAVVLSDSLADVVIAAGYETSLIAAADTCDQSEFSTLTKVSASDNQAVLGTGADIILSDQFSDSQKADFDAAGITYVAIAGAKNREDFERMYTQLGSVLGGASTGYNKGLDAAQNIFTSLDDLSRVIPKSETVVTGCYLFDTEGQAVTGDMLMSTIMTYSGITNVFKGSSGGTYEFENLRITNPQYIFCPIGMKDTIMADQNFKSLSAVKEGRVYEIDRDLAVRAGRSVVNAATIMAGVAYPELLTETSQEPTPKVLDEPEESAVPSPTPPVESAGEAIMKNGDDGQEVFELQAKLYDLGYITVEYDGLYGDVTEGAVKAFQKANGLQETGAVDAKTLEVLNSGSAVSASAGSGSESSASSSSNSESAVG